MFLEFYGLKEQPFGVTPDPNFICPSRTHSKAFNSLSCGIEAGCGFLALIAKPGMGKTTLIFQLLKQLEQTSRTILLFQTQCDSRELLRYLLSGLGLDAAGQDIVSMHERLNQLLARERLAGRRFVLVIDECQNLDNSVLETVRLLSDFETSKTKLIQIVLVGQTKLAEKLSSPNLAQLKQRISIMCHLEPLAREEIVRYIEHRLQLAGHAGRPLFTGEALEKIAAHSEGIPRNINNLCFNALILGYAAGCKQVDSAIVAQVLADLRMNPLGWKDVGAKQEAPALAQAPTIYQGHELSTTDPGALKGGLGRDDFIGADKRVAELHAIPSEPLPKVHQARTTPALQRTDASRAVVAGGDFPRLKVDSENESKVVSDFVADGLRRKPHLAQPPLQEAQSDPRIERSDFSGRKQIASSRVDISYLPASGGILGRRVWGTLAIVAALLLAGLLVFHSKVAASRRLLGLRRAALALTLQPTPAVSTGPAARTAPAASPSAIGTPVAESFPKGAPGGRIVRIVIDPGHGGHDTGTTEPTGLIEKDLCLDVALRLGRIIKQRLPDAEVIYTRTDDTFVSLEERTNIANEMKADLFLSIHVNSSPYRTARGVETYYLDVMDPAAAAEVVVRENATARETVLDRVALAKNNGRGEKIQESRVFAEDVQDSLSRLIQLSTSGPRNRSARRAPLVVLAGANMPSVLTEISFLSNPLDQQLLGKVEYRERLSEGLFQGVATYLQGMNSATYNPTHPNPPTKPL